MGRRIYSYADEIFAIGSELLEITQNQNFKKDFKFRVGVTDSVFKTVAYRVIEPVLRIEESVHLICTYGKLSRLLAEMSINQLDLVIADRPMPTNYSVRAHNH